VNRNGRHQVVQFLHTYTVWYTFYIYTQYTYIIYTQYTYITYSQYTYIREGEWIATGDAKWYNLYIHVQCGIYIFNICIYTQWTMRQSESQRATPSGTILYI